MTDDQLLAELREYCEMLLKSAKYLHSPVALQIWKELDAIISRAETRDREAIRSVKQYKEKFFPKMAEEDNIKAALNVLTKEPVTE